MRRGIRHRVATGLLMGFVGLVALSGLSGIVLASSAARVHAAQDLPDPPELETEIVSDSLASETIFAAGGCPTGKAIGHYVDEGFRLAVWGQCRPDGTSADVAVLGRGIQVPDGDVSVAFKVVSGDERTGFSLYTRINGRNSMGGYVNQGTGEVTLFKLADGNPTELATRTDGQSLLNEGDWNRLSIRAAGTDLWLLLNDEAVLYASDVSASAGGIGLRLFREGRVDDDELAVVVFSDLLVSPLADTSSDRAPTYQRP